MEAFLTPPPLREFPSLTPAEIEDIERRIVAGEPMTRVELHRIESQTPIVHTSSILTCVRGNLFLKRYLGVDLSLL